MSLMHQAAQRRPQSTRSRPQQVATVILVQLKSCVVTHNHRIITCNIVPQFVRDCANVTITKPARSAQVAVFLSQCQVCTTLCDYYNKLNFDTLLHFKDVPP